MSEDERANLKSELESTQLLLKEAQATLEATKARNADLEEEIGTARGQTEGYTAKVKIRGGEDVIVFAGFVRR